MRQALTSLPCPWTWYYTTLLYKTSHRPKTVGTAKLSRITDAVLSPDASTMHIQTPLICHSRWFNESEFVCQTHGLKLRLVQPLQQDLLVSTTCPWHFPPAPHVLAGQEEAQSQVRHLASTRYSPVVPVPHSTTKTQGPECSTPGPSQDAAVGQL